LRQYRCIPAAGVVGTLLLLSAVAAPAVLEAGGRRQRG